MEAHPTPQARGARAPARAHGLPSGRVGSLSPQPVRFLHTIEGPIVLALLIALGALLSLPPGAHAAPHPHETIGRRFTALPLAGFSSEDGPGYGFRVDLFDYDGQTAPYRWAVALQGFFTTRGKWAHLFKMDFPAIRPGERVEVLLRYDKEDYGNYFGGMSDRQIGAHARQAQTFRHLYPTLTANWIRLLRYPWRVRIGSEIGYTEVTPNTPDGGLLARLAPLGAHGGMLYSLEVALRYDTRDDYVDAASGILEEVVLRYSLGGGGDYHGGQIVHDHRHFLRLTEDWVFGQRLKTTVCFGNLPFYEEPKLGSSRTVRGVPADRYRDGGRILLNSELRWHGLCISRSRSLFVGLSGFADVGHVFQPAEGPDLSDWAWSVGGGPRVYWYSTVIRADLGVADGNVELYTRFAHVF